MKEAKLFGEVRTAASSKEELSSCKTMEEYREDRAVRANVDYWLAKQTNIREGYTMSLDECIERALLNNLDLKVFEMEENVADSMMFSEMLGMLPDLTVSDTLTGRSNTPASSSRKYKSEGATYGASTSMDRNVNYLNIDLALSVVDFGLAYFNTMQAEDRVLLRQQRTVRASQNLTLDVVRAYFQVAAAQRARNLTETLLEECKGRYEIIEELVKDNKITPFRGYEETNRFIEMEKRLTNYQRSYENSCFELRSLLGLYPDGEIIVDDALLDIVPDYTFPEITLLEQIALLQRPELYEIDIQGHVNILECRKVLVMMFPNVRMFMDFTNSNNSFLYHQSWWEIGIRAAYNVMKLPQQIARYIAYSRQVDAEAMRSYAQAIGVMAQVRMAHANIIATKERLDIDTRIHTTYANFLKVAEANKNITGMLSQLELDHMRLNATEKEIERILSLGNYYVAYYRILNTLGINDLREKTVADLQTELDAAKAKAMKELEKAEKEFKEQNVLISAPLPDDQPAEEAEAASTETAA